MDRVRTVRAGETFELTLEALPGSAAWTRVRSSAPALVLPVEWRVGGDGSARVVLRCARGRGGEAVVEFVAGGEVRKALRVNVIPPGQPL